MRSNFKGNESGPILKGVFMRASSPCTGICRLDEKTGWCLGCGRSRSELDHWRTKSEAWRQRIWKKIPQRLDELGVKCRRFPWTTEEIQNFVLSSLNNCQGTWVMGVVGAVAEFTVVGDAPKLAECTDGMITAFTQNGAIKMLINDDVRALNFDTPNELLKPHVVLAVKRDRGRLPITENVADLGEDVNPLILESAKRVFDLGLGRKEARFCVRVNEGESQKALTRCSGQSFDVALPKISLPLRYDSPTRVVETALGRIEVQGQIPTPNANSPIGPHTHLLPDHLLSERALPVGMELPRAYLPGAIFYPAM